MVPLSQGKPIEWKHRSSGESSYLSRWFPSRRGNQLNGNSPEARSFLRVQIGSPLAGETN